VAEVIGPSNSSTFIAFSRGRAARTASTKARGNSSALTPRRSRPRRVLKSALLAKFVCHHASQRLAVRGAIPKDLLSRFTLAGDGRAREFVEYFMLATGDDGR